MPQTFYSQEEVDSLHQDIQMYRNIIRNIQEGIKYLTTYGDSEYNIQKRIDKETVIESSLNAFKYQHVKSITLDESDTTDKITAI